MSLHLKKQIRFVFEIYTLRTQYAKVMLMVHCTSVGHKLPTTPFEMDTMEFIETMAELNKEK